MYWLIGVSVLIENDLKEFAVLRIGDLFYWNRRLASCLQYVCIALYE